MTEQEQIESVMEIFRTQSFNRQKGGCWTITSKDALESLFAMRCDADEAARLADEIWNEHARRGALVICDGPNGWTYPQDKSSQAMDWMYE